MEGHGDSHPALTETDNSSRCSRSDEHLDEQYATPLLAESVTGTVLWFNRRKGFGFIRRKDNEEQEVFVHKSAISRGPPHLGEGETVVFDIAQGPEGKSHEAKNVTGPNGRRVRGARLPGNIRFFGPMDPRFRSQPGPPAFRNRGGPGMMNSWVFCPCAYWMSGAGGRGGKRTMPHELTQPDGTSGAPSCGGFFPATQEPGTRLRAGRNPRTRRRVVSRVLATGGEQTRPE